MHAGKISLRFVFKGNHRIIEHSFFTREYLKLRHKEMKTFLIYLEYVSPFQLDLILSNDKDKEKDEDVLYRFGIRFAF